MRRARLITCAIVAAAALVWAGCSEGSTVDVDRPDLQALPPVDADLPDPYSAPAIGLKLDMPDAWHYQETTSFASPQRFSERLPIADLRRVIRRLDLPLLTMSPSEAPARGKDPVVDVLYRFAGEPPDVQDRNAEQPALVAQLYLNRLRKEPDYRVLETSELTQLGGLPAAVTRVAFTYVDPESGERRPVTVRIWNTKRDMAYFYVESWMPEPAPEGAEEDVERLVASLQLDPPRMLTFAEIAERARTGEVFEQW